MKALTKPVLNINFNSKVLNVLSLKEHGSVQMDLL